MKLWVWAGYPAYVEAWKDAGYHPVELASTDILTGLQAGLINAFPAPPLLALANQWFGVAKNMSDVKWAPGARRHRHHDEGVERDRPGRAREAARVVARRRHAAARPGAPPRSGGDRRDGEARPRGAPHPAGRRRGVREGGARLGVSEARRERRARGHRGRGGEAPRRIPREGRQQRAARERRRARTRRARALPEGIRRRGAAARGAAARRRAAAARALRAAAFPGSTGYVQNLALWIAFLGAMAASREGAHLALATGEMLPRARAAARAGLHQRRSRWASPRALAKASFDFVRAEMESPASIAGWLPQWVVESILPFAFAVIALRFLAARGRLARSVRAWLLGSLALGVAALVRAGRIRRWCAGAASACCSSRCRSGRRSSSCSAAPPWCSSTRKACRSPSIPVETYRSVVSPSIPTLPLFTLTGFLLAEGGASERLVRLFRALFGWLPGGPGDRRDAGLRLLHQLHRRVGRHDPRARRDPDAGAGAQRLPRGILARPDHRHRLDRPALPAEPAGDPLRRRRARADPGPVPRRASCRACCSWSRRGVAGHARIARVARAATRVRRARGRPPRSGAASGSCCCR